MVRTMDPTHLITAGLIFLGLAFVFGLRHILNFRREQREAERNAASPEPTEGGDRGA